MKFFYLSWEDIFNFLKSISKFFLNKNFSVVGIASSGLIPAAILCKLIKCKRFYSISLKLYTDDKPPKELSNEPLLVAPLTLDVNNQDVILVDDIASTGRTISKAREILLKMGARRVITVVIVKKKTCKESIDYFYLESEKCPVFPWETK